MSELNLEKFKDGLMGDISSKIEEVKEIPRSTSFLDEIKRVQLKKAKSSDKRTKSMPSSSLQNY